MNLSRAWWLPISVVFLGSCGRLENDRATSTENALTHSADLASHMPDHLAIMHVMAWFGVPPSNPLAPGQDPKWGNWQLGQMGCVPPNDVTHFDGSGNHEVASRYHPLAGIYSSTGRTDESVARIQLALSNLRSSCDDSARLDAFAIQIDGTHYSSMHGGTSGSEEIPLEALKAWLQEADAEGRTSAVLPSNDATWYWNNGSIDCATNHSACVAYVQQDVIDMLHLAQPHPSALRINGKLVLHFYVDSAAAFPQENEWQAIFTNARNATGMDFYTIGSHAPARFFSAFDALSPWVDPAKEGAWNTTSGSSVYAHTQAYATKLHKQLFDGVPAGHVVFGNIAAGFDDYTKHWGQCEERQIPAPSEGTPRHLDVIRGTADYLRTQTRQQIKGVFISTWDDWTEGSFFEPSTEEGVSKLVTLRQSLGALYGDAQSPTGDAALTSRWTSYGKTFPPSGGEGSFHPPALCNASPTPPVDPGACAAPVILEPVDGQPVGPFMHLRTSGGTCLQSQIAYLDGKQAAPTGTSSVDQWVSVEWGVHTLHVNAWDQNGTLRVGQNDVTFTRTY